MLASAAVITISVGLSIVLFLIVSLAVAVVLRIRRVRGLKENRDRRISAAIWGNGHRRGRSRERIGSRFNETDEYPVIPQPYDTEHGNVQSQNKDRWSSLCINLSLPLHPAKNIRKAIISGCLSPLSAIVQKTQTWSETSTTPSAVAELPSEISPRNTFENQEHEISGSLSGRDSLAALQSLESKPLSRSFSKSPITSPLKLDVGGRESPIPGPPPSKSPPPLPSNKVPGQCDPPGRRSTSGGSALSSKTTDTSILDAGTNLRPRGNVDLHGIPSTTTFHSFKLQGRQSGTPGVTRPPLHQQGKFGRYASWTPSNPRYSGWGQYPPIKDGTSRASTSQSRDRGSYVPVPTNCLVDRSDTSNPPMVPKRADKRNRGGLETDTLTRCETCRAITPEPWLRTQPNIESKVYENETCSETPTSLPTQEDANCIPKVSNDQLKGREPRTFLELPTIAPTGHPSRIPSPTRLRKPVQERWPVLPATRNPCKTSQKADGPQIPQADNIIPLEHHSTSNLCSPKKRVRVNTSRFQVPENSKATQTAISPLFPELSSSFPHERSETSPHPGHALREPVSLREKGVSYPPSICWPSIRPIASNHSAYDLRKSIMELRRMNSAASGRSKSLYLCLQCDEIPRNTKNISELSSSSSSNNIHYNHNHNTANLNINTFTTNQNTNTESQNDIAVIPRKSSSLGSNKTAGGSVWEDDSLPTAFGEPSFLSGRVSLEWPPKNERKSHVSAHGIGSQTSGDWANVKFVPGSLYDSNGFLKE